VSVVESKLSAMEKIDCQGTELYCVFWLSLTIFKKVYKMQHLLVGSRCKSCMALWNFTGSIVWRSGNSVKHWYSTLFWLSSVKTAALDDKTVG